MTVFVDNRIFRTIMRPVFHKRIRYHFPRINLYIITSEACSNTLNNLIILNFNLKFSNIVIFMKISSNIGWNKWQLSLFQQLCRELNFAPKMLCFYLFRKLTVYVYIAWNIESDFQNRSIILLMSYANIIISNFFQFSIVGRGTPNLLVFAWI